MARHLQVSREGKASCHADRVDVAARYLVYNLFVAISGTPERSRLLRDIDERVETLARAMERGWIEVFDRRPSPERLLSGSAGGPIGRRQRRRRRRSRAECTLCPDRTFCRIGREVSVDLGRLVVAMAHPSLQGSQWCASRSHAGAVGVTEIVKPQVTQAGSLERRFEARATFARVVGPAGLRVRGHAPSHSINRNGSMAHRALMWRHSPLRSARTAGSAAALLRLLEPLAKRVPAEASVAAVAAELDVRDAAGPGLGKRGRGHRRSRRRPRRAAASWLFQVRACGDGDGRRYSRRGRMACRVPRAWRDGRRARGYGSSQCPAVLPPPRHSARCHRAARAVLQPHARRQVVASAAASVRRVLRGPVQLG